MNCSSCGTTLESGVKFCRVCGAPVVESAGVSTSAASSVPVASLVNQAPSVQQPSTAYAPSAPRASAPGGWVPPGASTASPNRPGIQSFGSGVPVDAGSLRVAGMLMFVAAIIYLLVRLFLIFGFSAVVNMIGFSFLEYPVLILLIIPAILTAGAAIFMVQHANHASSAGGAAAGLLFYAISLIAGALLMAFHAVAIQRSYFSSMWMVEYALDIGFLSNILTVLNVVALVLALATIGFTFAATRQDYIDRGSLIAVLVVLVLIIVFSLFGMFALPAIYLLINEMGGVWAINIVSMITSLVIALFYTAFLALEGRMLLSFI